MPRVPMPFRMLHPNLRTNLAVTGATYVMKQRYESSEFHRILVYFSCSSISSGGIAQYLAYCRENGISPEVNTTKKAAVVFGNR